MDKYNILKEILLLFKENGLSICILIGGYVMTLFIYAVEEKKRYKEKEYLKKYYFIFCIIFSIIISVIFKIAEGFKSVIETFLGYFGTLMLLVLLTAKTFYKLILNGGGKK